MQATNQVLAARANVLTEEMRAVAAAELVTAEQVRAQVAEGPIVILANNRRQPRRALGVGRPLKVKININLGNSANSGTPASELEKLTCAIRYGADTVMDLSTGPGADEVLQRIIAASSVPVGTVPIYRAVADLTDPLELTPDLLLRHIQGHAETGVDFVTLHAGLRRAHLPLAKNRLLGIVSRGGALLANWMTTYQRENPLYERFDEVLAICREYDMTISLGDGLRPGCLADATDEAQLAELRTLGELVARCHEAGVQVMVEGPGHVPLDQVEQNIRLAREWCQDAPFYVLGPLVTDCAAGYDHIAAAMGAAVAGMHGAALLCGVTPKEHLGLPNLEDIREGTVTFKIAAHAANVATHRPQARDRDDAMSRARKTFDWSRQFALALDPDRARAYFEQANPGVPVTPCQGPQDGDGKYCTMCGPKFCAMRNSEKALR